MNYGASPSLLRQLMGIKSEVVEMRTQWLTSLSDADLAKVVGPGFATFFETLDLAIQWRMTFDKALCAEVVEDYRAWAEETGT